MGALENKIAIVTGSASGFGAEIARQYVQEGAKVVLADLNLKGATEIADSLGESAVPFECNVANKDDIDALVAFCCDKLGTPNIIVNNAGTTHRNQPLMDVDEETFDRVFAVNVKSLFYMTKATVPLMRKQGGGVVINIGSVAGIRPRPGLSWYNASKGAVNTLSRSLAGELGPDGIRVNAICPVLGETAMMEDFMGVEDTPENRAKFLAQIPLGRLAKSTDVAAAAVFLGSDKSEFITGVEFPVDGGRVI